MNYLFSYGFGCISKEVIEQMPAKDGQSVS